MSDWERVRPELTSGITGKPLVQKGPANMDVTVTRVGPGSAFSRHQDPYGHVIYVVQGEGEFSLGDDVHPVGPGTFIEVPAGEAHAYRNTGEAAMLLVTVNVPPAEP